MLPDLPLTEATDTTRIPSRRRPQGVAADRGAPYEVRLAPAGSDQIVAATGG